MSLKVSCSNCGKNFLILDQEEKFLGDHNWPSPTHCPDCRQTRRMALRNPRKLGKTTCDTCDKEIIISFDRGPGNVVYCKEHYLEWWDSSDHLIE